MAMRRVPIRWKIVALGLLTLCCEVASAQAGAVESLDLRVPLQPQPVRIGEQWHMFYELHFTSFAATPITLTDLTIAASESAVSERFAGDALAELVAMSGAGKDMSPQTLLPGMRGVIYLSLPWVSPIPRELDHRLSVDIQSSKGPTSVVLDQVVTPNTTPLPELGPPLRSGTWAALYDPTMERGHRRVLYAVEGHARLPGRFAIDFFGVDERGGTYRNKGERPVDYIGYGADVLAVADGTVVATRDDFVEPKTLADAPGRVSIGDATGVYVALDIGGGRFAFYEHLQPGLPVKVGQRVRRGDRIGALGLTGQTMTPHLHFHVANANAPLAAEGMPYHFASYRLLGRYATIGEFSDKPWQPLPSPRVIKRSLPEANVVLDFE